MAQSYSNLERHARENRDYIKILQRQLEMACQKLSEHERTQIRNDIASGLEGSLASSSSAGDTLGTLDAPQSPDHRPLRGRLNDDDLNHFVDGFNIVPQP